MDRNARRSFLRAAGAALPLALLALPALAQGDFAKVNGQVITREEYLYALEHVQVTLPGTSPPATIEAGRFVLDQLIAKKIVLDEAAKRGVLPSDADVQKRYDLQKKIVEQQIPGRTLESRMQEQGALPKMLRDEMRYQMAETNLLAKEMEISEDDIKKAYEDFKSRIGLPERAQLRIVAPQSEADFAQAQKQLQAKTDFAKVAQQFNSPSLRASNGLMAQPIPLSAMPPAWQTKVTQGSDGTIFGPVEWPQGKDQPPAKVWVKVEKKYAALALPYDQAQPLVKQQLVQSRLSDPQNAKSAKLQQFLQYITQQKLDAKFQPGDPRYQAIWEDLKRRVKQPQPQASAAPK